MQTSTESYATVSRYRPSSVRSSPEQQHHDQSSLRNKPNTVTAREAAVNLSSSDENNGPLLLPSPSSPDVPATDHHLLEHWPDGMSYKNPSTDSFGSQASPLGEQMQITAIFMGLMSAVLAACVVAGTITTLIGGAVLRAGGFKATSLVSDMDLAAVGASGACLAYFAMIWTLQLKLFEHLHERSLHGSRLWKALAICCNKALALSFASLTGLLGQLVLQPVALSTASGVLAGCIGGLTLIATSSLAQGLYYTITRKHLPVLFRYELWLPLPVHVGLIDQFLGHRGKAASATVAPHHNSHGEWKSSMAEDDSNKKGDSASSLHSASEDTCVSAYRQPRPGPPAPRRIKSPGEPDYDSMPDLWTGEENNNTATSGHSAV